MNLHPPQVIFIDKTKLESYKITLGETTSAAKVAEGQWTQDNLSSLLTKLVGSTGQKKFRVLLADELAVVLDLNIPKDATDERQVVKEKAMAETGLKLTSDNWDYKLTKTKLNEKQVKFFAPEEDFWHLFTNAVTEAGLEIEAMEPSALSLERHSNPVIGLALKKDLSGNDEAVLNVQPTTPTSFDYVDKSLPRKPVSKRLLLALGVLLLIIFGGIFISSKGKTDSPETSPSPVVESLPSPTPALEASPSAAINLDEYKVQILNGSGVAGEAGVVEGILVDAGFSDLDTGNAANYDYTDTEVSLKSTTTEAVFTAIASALESDYTVVKLQTPLTDSSDYDVVITIGTKKTN